MPICTNETTASSASSPLVVGDPDAERFESLWLFFEKAASLWLSLGEASFRADREEACRRWPAQAALFARVRDNGRSDAALIGLAGILRNGGAV